MIIYLLKAELISEIIYFFENIKTDITTDYANCFLFSINPVFSFSFFVKLSTVYIVFSKMFDLNLLWTLQIPMYDFMHMQVMHPAGYLLGPRHHPVYRYSVFLILEQIKERPVRAELHHDAITRRFLRTHASELDYVRMVQLTEVSNIGFLQFGYFLHSYRLIVEYAGKYGALAAAT